MIRTIVTSALFLTGLSLNGQIYINGHEYSVSGKLTFSCNQDAYCLNKSCDYLEITSDSIIVYTWYQKTVDHQGEPYASDQDYIRKQSVSIKDIFNKKNKSSKKNNFKIYETTCSNGTLCPTKELMDYMVIIPCNNFKVTNYQYKDNEDNDIYKTSSLVVHFNDKIEAEDFMNRFKNN